MAQFAEVRLNAVTGDDTSEEWVPCEVIFTKESCDVTYHRVRTVYGEVYLHGRFVRNIRDENGERISENRD